MKYNIYITPEDSEKLGLYGEGWYVLTVTPTGADYAGPYTEQDPNLATYTDDETEPEPKPSSPSPF